MEAISNRRIAKAFVATIGGMVTLFLVPWAVIFAFAGLAQFPDEKSLSNLALGTFGLFGLFGFWAWVFSRPPLSKQRRVVLSALISCGIGTAIAVVAQFGEALNLVFVASALIGLSVVISIWLPNTSVNTDAPKAARSLP
jgi:hypothetical protein